MKINGKTKGIICIIAAAFGFSLMSVFVRLAGDLPSFQKAFFRNFIALIFMTGTLLKKKTGFLPRKENALYLVGRSLFGTIGIVCNFYAIDRLVLADANMLNKLSPFFAIIFSALLLKEKPDIVQLCAVAAAFAGTVMIVKPGFTGMSFFPAAVGTLGGAGAGIAYTFVRKLGCRGEDSTKIIFWFSAFSTAVCLGFMLIPGNFEKMSVRQLLFMCLAGLCACIGQFGITNAYIFAPAKEISVYDYSQVVFAALLGFILFGQIPDILSILGYALICGAGIAMFFYNKRRTYS
ncbi:MAG: DMT family transporter [Clostridia bacterium]|nr:DMT family transporter [Clostridia bacterium]